MTIYTKFFTPSSGRDFSFIALEFMAGGDLMEHNRARPKLGLTETLYYFKQICDGLRYISLLTELSNHFVIGDL